MTDTHSESIILALNSGSSSLKFGLYRVSTSRTEALLSGEAQSIGEEGGRFHAQDSQANSLLTETVSIPTQRDAIRRIGQVLAGCKLPAPVAVGHRIVHGGPNLRQHCLIDELVLRQLDAATARCIRRQLCRLSASRKNIFRGFRRWHVSTPHFMLGCPRLRACFRSRGNCDWRVSSAMVFMVFRADRSCISLPAICRIA